MSAPATALPPVARRVCGSALVRDTLVPFSRLRGKVPAGRMGGARAEDSRWRINSFRATVAGDGFRAPAALNSFRAPAAPESLSLACPRESNQRERHPAWRLPGVPPGKSVSRGRAFRPDSCPDEKASTSMSTPAGAACRPRLTAAQGTQIKSVVLRDAQSVPPKRRSPACWLATLPRPCAASAAWLPGPQGDRQEADPFSSA